MEERSCHPEPSPHPQAQSWSHSLFSRPEMPPSKALVTSAPWPPCLWPWRLLSPTWAFLCQCSWCRENILVRSCQWSLHVSVGRVTFTICEVRVNRETCALNWCSPAVSPLPRLLAQEKPVWKLALTFALCWSAQL